MRRKGIILAGGSATRLRPATLVISKQLLPIHDKPMIYYPLSTLMLAGIRDILIISTPNHLPLFEQLLGDGSKIGLNLSYLVQDNPNGLAEAFIIAEEFLNGAPSVLILGDNLFYGNDLKKILLNANLQEDASNIFTYPVSDPQRYGVAYTNENGKLTKIVEKPTKTTSNKAITGLYFLDGSAPDFAKQLKPSSRGELEIIDLLDIYLDKGILSHFEMGRGFAWMDTGTHESLLEASTFVHAIEKRQGLKLACIEEVAYLNGWITSFELEKTVEDLKSSDYGKHLAEILNRNEK